MKKILILGICGSGKTTLAESLGKKLGLEVIKLDKYFWKPGWRKTPKTEWLKTVRELTNKESWIIEGNYCESLDMRICAADTTIILEMGRWTTLFRVLKIFLVFSLEAKNFYTWYLSPFLLYKEARSELI